MTYDHCIIGGGIVGLAAAMNLLARKPEARVIVVEKETSLASHQTGHNSGVIHAGIYYRPGSLKARLCRRGAAATKAFCREHDVPFEECGKLLVATNDRELEHMAGLEARAEENGITVERLDAGKLREMEPHISGMGALRVPATGIVDYARMARAMAMAIERAGGEIRLGEPVEAIQEAADAVTVETSASTIHASSLIACAGLQSDRIARLAGMEIRHRIIPFRGEFYTLPKSKSQIIRHLIYPIPDPAFPFLGIHLTRMIDGSVTVGPNAVLGLNREGYRKGSFNARDARETLGFPGFWRLTRKYWKSGLGEMRNSLFKRAYLEQCRKYCPELELSDLLPRPAGIRAQAVDRDGTLMDDFVFLESRRMLHVCNAPSPAATSSIPIGESIVDRVLAR